VSTNRETYKVGSITLILDSMDLRTEEQGEERDKKKSRVGTLKKHGYSFAKRLIPKNINVPDFIYKVNFEAGKGLDGSPISNFESII